MMICFEYGGTREAHFEFLKAFLWARVAQWNDAECRKYSLREKYKMLEALGGRNQRYLAETPEEASRSFVSSASSPLLMKYADVPQEDKYTPYCNKECETIRIRLENALEKRQPKRRLWAAAPFSLAQHDDVGHVEIERDFSSMGKCSLGCTSLHPEKQEFARGLHDLLDDFSL
uniref:RGS domain-containing protein n=1 Tax=Angiostrongylus cantonensis TaxID=6313 RepID=A0A0K0CTY0_ANGCA